MIAYEELAAALERWRIRNGLPGTPPLFADGPRKPSAAAVVYSAPPVAQATYAPPRVVQAPAPMPPRAAPPIAPPPPPAETIDEDLDVLDEDHLDNDGPDFALGFDSAPAARPAMPGMNDDDAREASQIGGTDPGIVPPSDDDVWPAPKPLAAIVDDDDDDGGTLVNG